MRRFFGWVLLTMGVLWTALTGLCTLGFSVLALVARGVGRPDYGSLLAFLGIGAAFSAPGVIGIFWGRSLLRARRQADIERLADLFAEQERIAAERPQNEDPS